MQTRSRSTFTSIHTEGSLLPVDLLQRVLSGDKDLGGLTPPDYHLPGNEKLNEAINRSWNRLQGAWATFQTSKSRLKPGDPRRLGLRWSRIGMHKSVALNISGRLHALTDSFG